MPDLQTELKAKVLPALDSMSFDDDDPTQPPTQSQATMNNGQKGVRGFLPTNNVTRETFNYVRDNPGKKRVEVVRALELRGFKPSSTASLVTQMLSRGTMVYINNGIHATTSEYVAKNTRKARAKPKAKPKSKAEPKPKAVAAPTTSEAQAFVDSLKLSDARAIYDELKKVFGA
jgi:hypothetical protein